jgi:transcriptional pleiotropic regulator of transition state genes
MAIRLEEQGRPGPRATGVSRKVDDLGRIVLPAELRRSFDIREGDHIDIAVEEDRIVLSKKRTMCTFCNSGESLRTYREHPVCAGCLAELKRF